MQNKIEQKMKLKHKPRPVLNMDTHTFTYTHLSVGHDNLPNSFFFLFGFVTVTGYWHNII